MNGRVSTAGALSARWLVAALLATGVVGSSGCTASDDEVQPAATTTVAATITPSADPIPVVCLRTEFFPIAEEDGLLQNRLARELARQAVLIAARDGLGLPTRDKTLGEPFPQAVALSATDLELTVRAYEDGTLRLCLSRADGAPGAVPWEHEAKFTANCVDAYPTLLEVLEPLSRGELVDALRGMGFEGQVPPPDEDNRPSQSVLKSLDEMNFVSQYAAVRAAHAAIAAGGPSTAWLGVLARGYANLALLTDHHWSSNQDAFAARGLLYVERMNHLAGAGDLVARAHRAYVQAVIGMHAGALAELGEIEALPGDREAEAELPAWVALLGPYCRFERQALLAVGDKDRDLAQLARRLEFNQCYMFGDDRWSYESAQQAMRVCPEAYGVYAALCEGGPLGVVRTGAYYGPAAMSRLLPARLAALPGLPPPLRSAADPEWRQAMEERTDPNPNDPFSVVPHHLAAALEAMTGSGADAGEPSWAVLGKLIDEEQFVEAANYMRVATNAVESSLAEDVAGVLPLIKDHRYAPYVESFSVNMYQEVRRYYDILGDMRFPDPRGVMQPMYWRAWKAYDNDGKRQRGNRASWAAFCHPDFTLLGMSDPISRLEDTWWNDISPEQQATLIDQFDKVAPHAPQVLRMAIHATKNPSHKQLAEWEQQAGEDAYAFTRLGRCFRDRKRYDDAIRCYQRAIELSPRIDAFTGLADSYRAAGQEELWQPTLERYFEVEDLGLGHAQVHSKIAGDLIKKGKWEEAEPHAVAAAQTWSAWGLDLAAEVEEGLGHWDDSERWVRESATSYPSSSGYEWYFWCLRTGRGNRQAARQVADTYLKSAGLDNRERGQGQMFVACLCEEKLPDALAHLKALAELCQRPPNGWIDRSYCQIHLAMVAREMGDSDTEQAALAELRRLVDEEIQPNNKDFAAVNLAVLDLLDGHVPSEEERAAVDKSLESLDRRWRCDYEYFLGRALDLGGETELADSYLTRAVTRGPYARHNSTLAGYYLAKRHGTSRP